MEPETVYRIPENVLRKSYLKKEDLEKLIECILFYFIRESKYKILHDYPALGSYEKRLIYSKIEGPFSSFPTIKEEKLSSQLNFDIVEFLVPKDLMPVDFEKISLIKYEIKVDRFNVDFIRNNINYKDFYKMFVDIGKRTLENIKKIQDFRHKKEAENYIILSKDNYMLEFSLSDSEVFPSINFLLLEKGENSETLFKSLRISKLEDMLLEKIDLRLVDYFVKNIRVEGVAYNFSFDGNKINDIIKKENVLF